MRYLRKYPLSIITIGIILFLSFFNPPKTSLNEITNIDKVLHFLMYFGLCCILWLEYFRSHEHTHTSRLIIWGIAAPILLSGAIEIGQQTLTPTRAADWGDFACNTLGCLTAAIFGQLVTRHVIKRHKKTEQTRKDTPAKSRIHPKNFFIRQYSSIFAHNKHNTNTNTTHRKKRRKHEN
jgi:VanZ family protein